MNVFQCNTVAEKPAGLAAFTVFLKVFCFVIVNNIKIKYIVLNSVSNDLCADAMQWHPFTIK